MISVKHTINSAMIVNNSGVKVESYIHREVRKNHEGKNDRPLPGVVPITTAK